MHENEINKTFPQMGTLHSHLPHGSHPGFITRKTMKSYDIAESVKGKNVVITGASTGIGEHLAYQYSQLGANVVITARREQRLKEVMLYNE